MTRVTRIRRRWGLAALGAAAAGCSAAARVEPLTTLPSTAQAISLLGDTLWNVPLDLQTARLRLERLQRARQLAASKPDDVNAALGLARQTAGMGRLREAIQLANAGLEKHYADPRLYRLRGELLLRTRRVDLAITDLQAAARLTIQDSTSAEFIEIDGLDEEPEQTALVGIGVRYFTLRLLGQAYYVRGDFRRARAALNEALQAATNADEAAMAAVWLVLADQRAGSTGLAESVVRAWRAAAQVVMHRAEHRLLLAWQGTLPMDSLRMGLRGPGSDAEALYTLAAAVAYLARGEVELARPMLEVVRAVGDWNTMPFLAAEAELRRIRDRPGRG